MALEGKISSYKFSFETIVTDNHPAFTQALIMDETVKTKLIAGTVLKSVEPSEDATKSVTKPATFAVCTDADTPRAILLEDFDPAENKTGQMCLLHGSAKKDLILVNGAKPSFGMLDKLAQAGIFTV